MANLSDKSKSAPIAKDNSYYNYPVSIRKEVCRLLDENHLLTAKMLCKQLNLPYKKYKQTITNYRSFWKYNIESERGSKCSNFHCFEARVKLDLPLSKALRQVVQLEIERDGAGFGWVPSKAKNKFWIWRGNYGRVVWFETGSVRLHIRRPGNLGKAKQLFCNAFVKTGLINDFKLLNPMLDRIRPKSCHFPYRAGARLPYMIIRDFEASHGVIIKVGDRSHPDAVEVIASFPEVLDDVLDKLEKLERNGEKSSLALAKLTGILSNIFDFDSDKRAPKVFGGKDYVV